MAQRENFGSKLGAILAAAGSAVGLGNVWRFPIETGQNGGAAYIIIYIGCILLFGLPVMMSEFIIGKNAKCNCGMSFGKFTKNPIWKYVGILFILTAFIIISYYAVVAGWTFEYLIKSLTNQFSGKSAGDYQPMFNDFASNPLHALACTFAVFLITHIIIARGVQKGIEKYSKILMPILFIVLIILVVLSINLDGAAEGINFLLNPDFSKINGHVIISALGQAFYSLSLGMGALITYSSYFDKDTNLMKTGVNVCIIDTVVAIMAGFIIFPAVFNAGYSLRPEDIGPSLIFVTLPNVFQQCFVATPWLGYIFSVMFFFLLLVSAITSMISLHEVVTSFFFEKFNISRRVSTRIMTALAAFLGIFCTLSTDTFSLFDMVSSNILLPFGGIMITIFVGWVIDKRFVNHTDNYTSKARIRFFNIMRFLIRYVAPIGITAIFLQQFGLF